MTNDEKRLKLCPFCGKTPLLFKVVTDFVKRTSIYGFVVGCHSDNNCSMTVRTKAYKTRATAKKHWNYRL